MQQVAIAVASLKLIWMLNFMKCTCFILIAY